MAVGDESLKCREIQMTRTGEDICIAVTIGGVRSAVTVKVYELQMALSLRANNGSYFGSQFNESLIDGLACRRNGLYVVKDIG